MSFIEAIILGILQGLTEFLPVSSSAHLRIAGEILPSATDPGATFTAITQLGTEAAVLVYFWGDITRIIGKWFRHFTPTSGIAKNDADVRMGWLIIIGTVPIVLAGFFLQETIRGAFRSLWLVAIVLIVFGIILGIADQLGRRDKKLDDITYRDGILYGLAQTLALIPGVSRSGATTTMGRALGYERPAAAQYAFLLAVPAVFGSGFYELYNSITEPEVDTPFSYLETGVATVVAFGVGLAVIAFLMQYIKTKSFMPFVIYRLVLGSVLLVLLATGVLDPL
ncbi:undecaprenyl-diphosphate phosphatase [Marisediminicola senii]|uniref:undecaprenyl-diphosphate phosphatase n=1 Tax=Marisediminicola senii TaxID=2711233 RepID=UPI0013ECE824|nr:undecaprenyl-diphosphate phosphatase [Marisediminicola senii]